MKVVKNMIWLWLLGAAIPVFAVEKAKTASIKPDFKIVEEMANEDSDFAVQLYREAGQRSLNRSNPKRAILMYEQALLISPDNLNVIEELADAQIAAKDVKGAMASWDRIMQAQGNDLGNRIRYANFLSKAGEHDLAIKKARDIAVERPQEPSMRYWIADAYERAGKNSEAAAELKGMLKDFPGEKAEIQRRIDRYNGMSVKTVKQGEKT